MTREIIKEIVNDRVSKKKIDKKKLTTLSFFSGALGLDIGLEKEGFNVVLTCEYDKASRNTIILNDKKVGLIKDIRNYSSKDVLKFSNLNAFDEVDVIVGGPPCQAFSTAGKQKGFSDERGNVFLKFLELIEEIRPKYFVIENVRGLMSSKFQIDELDNISAKIPEELLNKKGSSLYYVIKRLENANYNINFDLYNSANFGTPQSRERIVIIGTTNNIKVNRLKPTHSDISEYNLPKWRTLKDAFKKLKNIDNSEHLNYKPKRIFYYEKLKSGENWKNLPIDLQKKALGGSYFLGGGKTGFLRRLDWNKPSPTLVTSPSMPATDLCHPEEIRPLSINEYKVIQQFPITWKLGGTTIDKYRQIGNAVPVGLGRAIGKEIQAHLQGQFSEAYPNFKYSRYKQTSYKEFMLIFERMSEKQKVPTLFD